jgi:hypothetical protein
MRDRHDEMVSAYPMNGEEFAIKHDVVGLALRNMLRSHPDLVAGHREGKHYRIDRGIEARIIAHREFQGLPKR